MRALLRSLERRLSNRLMRTFEHWFCSAGGVWQTFLVVVALGVYEIVVPSFDQHGFWLMWTLTVYSAVTQPALAHGNAVASEQIMGLLGEIRERLQ